MRDEEPMAVHEAAPKYSLSEQLDDEWMDEIEELVFRAEEELGIRLEIMDGMTAWEAHPRFRHQSAIDRIRATIKRVEDTANRCECIHVADVTFRFPNNSIKTPDIAILCAEPAEQDTAVRAIPEAVVEVLSRGSKRKDLELGVPFYLKYGVKDVIVVNPETGNIAHHRDGSVKQFKSPAELHLLCGCTITV